MSSAVVRVVVDPQGALTTSAYENGLMLLRRDGFEVIASPASQLPDRRRQIELILDDLDAELLAQECLAACSSAFGTEPELGVVTYISRGTDDDARGVLRRFDVRGQVERTLEGGADVVTVTIAVADSRRVPESRLHTALEAALNAEVRIVIAHG